MKNPRSDLEIYQNFIAWLGKTGWRLPESDQLEPLIKARYSVEEAAFLTGIPFSGNNLEELAELKDRDPVKSIRVLQITSRSTH